MKKKRAPDDGDKTTCFSRDLDRALDVLVRQDRNIIEALILFQEFGKPLTLNIMMEAKIVSVVNIT